jgi:hypothetical protein
MGKKKSHNKSSARGHWEEHPLNKFRTPQYRPRQNALSSECPWVIDPPLPPIWVEDERGYGGRHPSMPQDQIERGRDLLHRRLRVGPPFPTKKAAVQWLRDEQKLGLAPTVSDKAVTIHIVNPEWPEPPVSKRTK